MFSKGEASQLRTSFWTAFGQYMLPVKNAEDDEKTNWVNYKTGVKDVFFRMKTESNLTMIAIELTHTDAAQRTVYYDHFLSLKPIFEETMKENWEWEEEVIQDGKSISRISKKLPTVTIYKKEDWPSIISFFKKRMIALDLFWSIVKYSFEMLP